MVYKFAKILIVLSLSLFAGYALAQFIYYSISKTIIFGPDSWGTVFLMLNYVFGWLIYAIPFAIIGFKIYPKQKIQNPKK